MKTFFSLKKNTMKTIAFLPLAMVLLFSCKNLLNAPEKPLESPKSKPSAAPQPSGYETYTPSVEIPRATVLFNIELPKEFKDILSAQPSAQHNARTVLPYIDESSVIYKAKLVDYANSNTIDLGKVEKQFSENIPIGNYKFTVTANINNSPVLIGSAALEVTGAVMEKPITILLDVNTANTDKGTLSLPVEWDADSGINSVKYKITGDADFTDLAPGTKTITREIQMGVYEVIILFLKDNELCYSVQTGANVFAYCETNLWRDEEGIDANGKLHVTKALVDAYQNYTFFVKADSTAGQENGSYYNPYKKLQSAIDAVCAKNDGASQYTIYVDGNCSAESATPLANFGTLSKNLNLSIIGIGATTPKLTGNDASVIYAEGSAGLNLTLKKFFISGGAAQNGGGIYFAMNSAQAKLVLDNVTIEDCEASQKGSAVYSTANMEFAGATKVSNKCMVYLADGKTINLADTFTFSSLPTEYLYKRAAKIDPQTYAVGNQILTGSAEKMVLHDQFATRIGYYKIDDQGKLFTQYADPVYLNSASPYDIEEGTTEDPAKSLEAAIALLNPESTAPKIIIVQPYTLVADDAARMDYSENAYKLTLQRGVNCTGNMITVDGSKIADITIKNIIFDGNKERVVSSSSGDPKPSILNITSTSANKATVTLEDVNIQNNSGYGINISKYSSLTLESGSVKGNTSHGIRNYGTLAINGGEISSGTTYGVYNSGSSSDPAPEITMSGGLIKNNTSGGIYNNYGKITVEGGAAISERGYGIYTENGKNAAGGDVNINGGTITSSGYSGVYVHYTGGTVNIKGGTIKGTNGVEMAYYYNAGNASVNVSGDANISGTGTGSSNGYGIYAGSGALNVSGGETSGRYGIYAGDGSVTVASGKVTGSVYGIYMYYSSSSSGTVTLKGGEISGTTYGVYYQNGTALNMQGAATVPAGIFLATGKKITVTGALTCADEEAGEITPQAYEADKVIIGVGVTGIELQGMVNKFTLKPNPSGEEWFINKNGALQQNLNAKVIYLDAENGNDNNDGQSKAKAMKTLKNALIKLSKQDSATIIFVKPYTLASGETLDFSDATLYPNGVSFKRYYDSVNPINSFKGDLITITSAVASNSSSPLEIKNVTFDGIKSAVTNATGSLIKIESGAYVSIEATAVVQDNAAMGINNAGTLTVNGAKITGNTGYGINNTGTLTVNGGAIFQKNSIGISNSGSLTIDGAKITGNTGYGINNTGTLTINNAATEISNNSYGVYNNGSTATTTIDNGTFKSNSYGIYNSNGTVTLNNGSITLNKSGGIYNTGSGSNLFINGGSITNHTMTSTSSNYVRGAGIYNTYGTVEITGGTISGNKVENTSYASYAYGGGIYNATSGRLTISGGTISGNTAYNGAGVYNSSTLTISGGTISGNTATYGGGIYNNNNNLTISGGTISGNTATTGSGIYHYSSSSSYKLSMKDDAIIDDSNDVYLDNSSRLSYIAIAGTINGDGKIANITMASYTNSNNNVLYADSSIGVENYFNRFELSDSSYCLTKYVYSSSYHYGILTKKGVTGNVALPSYTLALKKKTSASTSSSSNLSSGGTLTTGNVVLFSLANSDVVPTGANYKISVMQGGTEIPALTKTVSNISEATVTIPASLAKLKPTVSIYAAVIIDGKYVYDTRVDNIKVQ